MPVPATRGEAGGPQEAHGGGPPRQTDGRPRRAVDHQGPRGRIAALHGEVRYHDSSRFIRMIVPAYVYLLEEYNFGYPRVKTE